MCSPSGPSGMSGTDRTRVLNLLADGPEDAGELSRRLGISRSRLFSLLMKMENEDLIVWDGKEWAVKESSDPKRRSTPPSSPGDDRTGDYA